MNTPYVLVLDFGGVISKTLFETHDLTEKSLGLQPGTLTWHGPFKTETDPLWMSMQQGDISERDYWTTRAVETGNLIGQSWTKMQQFVIAARGSDVASIIRPQFIDALKKTRAGGIRCAILSNELELFYGAGFGEKLHFVGEIELIIDATYTQILKPDPRAYLMVTDGMKVNPQDCVFVDDQLRNVDGAKAIGMRSVHFDVQNPQESYEEALALLGV